MKMFKRSFACFLAVLTLMMVPLSVSASDIQASKKPNSDVEYNMSQEGPEVVFDLGQLGSTTLEKGENGVYSGEIQVPSPKAVVAPTVVKCFLSPRAGGVETLHHIIITWSGGNRVNSMKASSLMIRKSNLTSTKIYYNKPFSRNCGSTYSGTITLGTVTIPKSVKSVHVSTKGLMCYFNNRDYWLSLGNMSGNTPTNY